MRVLVGILGLAAIGLVLVEFFVTYLLPRRVKRDARLARQLYDYAWRPWRALSRRLHPAAADTFLGMFGPLGLIGVLGLWTVGLILGFSALLWANDSSLTPTGATHYGSDLYFSAATFFSAGTAQCPRRISHVLVVLEAASGLGSCSSSSATSPPSIRPFRGARPRSPSWTHGPGHHRAQEPSCAMSPNAVDGPSSTPICTSGRRGRPS